MTNYWRSHNYKRNINGTTHIIRCEIGRDGATDDELQKQADQMVREFITRKTNE